MIGKAVGEDLGTSEYDVGEDENVEVYGGLTRWMDKGKTKLYTTTVDYQLSPSSFTAHIKWPLSPHRRLEYI